MEEKLKILFDYQRFEKNPRLERLILKSDALSVKALSDDDLADINAAGTFEIPEDENPFYKG